MEIDPTPTQSSFQQPNQQQQDYVNQFHHNTSQGKKLASADEEKDQFTSSPMNFDYLQGVHDTSGTGAPPNSARSSMSAFSDSGAPGAVAGAGAGAGAVGSGGSSSRHYESGQIVDDSRVIDRPVDLNERFVSVLDHLDAHVEKFRKDALGLQEKRDYLLMSIDLIKSNDLLQNMSDPEREEIHTYIQRVNARLGTVELNVRTVRDTSQEDSLSQINALIDMMITMGDPVLSRQRCQQYLNACCSSAETFGTNVGGEHFAEINVFVQESSRNVIGLGLGAVGIGNMETDLGPVDKKFESVLLGCTLDDQKNIKKRLQALMDYLNKQTVSH